MMTTRRDALVFLGLAGAASPALATENMVVTKHKVATGRSFSKQKTAAALRRLADGIDRGEVEVMSIDLRSTLVADEILTQTFEVKFNLPEALGA